jgi:hypothetical protein
MGSDSVERTCGRGEGSGYYPVSSADRRDIRDVDDDELAEITEMVVNGEVVKDEAYENSEFLKFEIALSFVGDYLDVLIPDLKSKMSEAEVSNEEDDYLGDCVFQAQAERVCKKFCTSVAEEIKDLTYVYYEVILGFIETEFCVADIVAPEGASSWADVISGAVKNLHEN